MSERQSNYIPVVEACLIGCLAGISAVVLGLGVSWIGQLRIQLAQEYHAPYILALCGLVGGLISGLLVERIAPEASGSGIPQVRAALSRVKMALNFRIALVKLLGGMIALGSGLFMGREGPTVQLGAAVAAPVSRWFPTTIEHRRQLIAAGAGAGLAAAFNAPLAGVIFVLEELLKEIKVSTVIIAVVACAAASVVLNQLDPAGPGGFPLLSSHATFSASEVPYYVLLGVACGIFGAIFNRSIVGALSIYERMKVLPMTLKVGLAGMLSGAIISMMPTSFHNYAGIRSLIIAGDTAPYIVPVAFLEFFLLTLIAYGSGAPGGLFAPSLAIGSALGFMCGWIEQYVTGTGSTATFALVGMGAFFAGVARVPLTAIAITFELTTNFALVPPLMISCVIASALGERLAPGSLYDHLMVWNGIHLRLQDPSTEKLAAIKAKDLMHNRASQVLSSNMTIKSVLSKFGSSTTRGLPVVDNGKLVGVVSQSDIGALVHSEELIESITVKQVMTSHLVAVSPHDSLEDILHLFTQYKFTWLPVADDDVFLGVISQSDVVKAMFVDTGTDRVEESWAETGAQLAPDLVLAPAAAADNEPIIDEQNVAR